ncbi:hypothetical protein [Pseudoteredinibacter isoporae]|uniref:Cytochrome oxidase Cu insertion factor, SCO1/SenC/PrrC family n=1 Tax=Pseudoteredinibacter isoporae TaxID=570281 RepID=A0A7X0MVR5_9GAMM|nr:hypothetical protein [Pseudoteredinibacter isoporae]MBB6520129.1 hypothetical protein [Pseudoteredinibacter isoporae]NHO85701.1 hypothetical protein [Pseudoteredinibacter isoporae]NIB25847.1 hypothetical protein [Pseudoteredinibacter isoporae]
MVAQVQDADSSIKPNKGIGNWQAVLLFGIIALPMILALLIYKTGIGKPGSTINEGVLLTPAKQVDTFAHADTQGQSLLASGKKWRLLIPYHAACNEACLSNFYITRQVHIRLGEKARRVERVMVSLGAMTPALETLLLEHPRLRVMPVDSAVYSNWLAEASLPEDSNVLEHYFLVDENGFAMMAYSAEHDGNKLLKDIKRVLKFTSEE